MPTEDFYDSGAAKPTSETIQPAEGKVSLLPKSFFPDSKAIKPGDFCRVKVEEVQEDQVLVSPAPAAADEDYERDEEMEAMMQ